MFSPDFIYLHKTNRKSLGPRCVEHSYPLVYRKKKKKKKNPYFSIKILGILLEIFRQIEWQNVIIHLVIISQFIKMGGVNQDRWFVFQCTDFLFKLSFITTRTLTTDKQMMCQFKWFCHIKLTFTLLVKMFCTNTDYIIQ